MGTACRQEGDASASVLVNTEAILDMQRKLYGWSRTDPHKVFPDLFNIVCDRRNLHLAWRQLSKNKGSRTPGVDGMTRRRIEERPGGVSAYLEEVREGLRTGTYTPQPVRQRLIPKPGKPGKFRPLGIPTLTDRLVQMAVKNVLEPIFETDFYPTSYGFRRGRNTLDALATIQQQLHPTSAGSSRVQYVIEGDIKGCFDAIDHHLLMERIRKRVRDGKVLRLVRAFLKAGIMAEGSLRHPVAGTPQGGIISPLLANVALTALDEQYRQWTPAPHEPWGNALARRALARRKGRPSFFLVRYADDFVILVTGTQEEAEQEKERLAMFLREKLRMELSLEKTLVTQPEAGFEFLGHRVVKEPARLTGRIVGKLYIPKGKLQLLRNRLKHLTDTTTTWWSLEDLLLTLNPIIAGWRNYYRYATGAYKDFMRLDRWMWFRIYHWLRKKHKPTSAHRLDRRFHRRVSPTRKTWGEGEARLESFTKGGTARYRFRGARVSNGWNDEWDGVRFYREVTYPLAGFTWVGALFPQEPTGRTPVRGEPDAGKHARPVRGGE